MGEPFLKFNSIAEDAKGLRKMAQLTQAHSKNWDNFEDIARSLLAQAFQAGRSAEARQAEAARRQEVKT